MQERGRSGGISRRGFIKAAFPPVGIAMDRRETGSWNPKGWSKPTKIGVAGYASVAGVLVGNKFAEVNLGIFPLRWLSGPVLREAQELSIRARGEDTTDFIIFEPSWSERIDGFHAVMSSTHCGLEDTKCEFSMMWRPRGPALDMRNEFLKRLSKEKQTQFPKAEDLIYLLSNGEDFTPAVIGEEEIRRLGNIIQAESAIFNLPGRFVAFQPTDCAGITLVDPGTKTLVVIHGNRSVAETNIIGVTFDRMRELGLDSASFYAWVPPVAHQMEPPAGEVLGDIILGRDPENNLNITDLYHQQLVQNGVLPQNIDVSTIDTVNSPYTLSNYASHHNLDSINDRKPVYEWPFTVLEKGVGNHLLIAGFSE